MYLQGNISGGPWKYRPIPCPVNIGTTRNGVPDTNDSIALPIPAKEQFNGAVDDACKGAIQLQSRYLLAHSKKHYCGHGNDLKYRESELCTRSSINPRRLYSHSPSIQWSILPKVKRGLFLNQGSLPIPANNSLSNDH